MEEKGECNKRETKEIYTLLFTAGTALLMACLKRAIMLILIEQWRLWVFLVLNLVLLAIFFTSMHSTSSDHQTQQSHDNVKSRKQCGGCENIQQRSKNMMVKIERMRRHKQSVRSKVVLVEVEKKHKLHGERRNQNEEEGLEDDCEDDPRLSKEELNERVEAFIATFRQHLVLDARKGRDQTFLQEKIN